MRNPNYIAPSVAGKASTLKPRPLSPVQKFERYWTEEKKILYRFFDNQYETLLALRDRWLKSFDQMCLELQHERARFQQERARINALEDLRLISQNESSGHGNTWASCHDDLERPRA